MEAEDEKRCIAMTTVVTSRVESLEDERRELMAQVEREGLNRLLEHGSDAVLRAEDVRLLRRLAKLNFLLGDDTSDFE